MGLTSSTPGRAYLSQEQSDIKFLGDRMPFGDGELLQIYRAYQQLRKCSTPPPNENGNSQVQEQELEKCSREKPHLTFLTDLGAKALKFSTDSTDSAVEERRTLLAAVEQTILPAGFGNRLYRTSFIRPQDVSEYDVDPNDGYNSNSNTTPDEYARLAKLEIFFEGLSNCGRKDTKSTLKVLVACCQPHQEDPKATKLVLPIELVDTGYRVALASAFLQATSRAGEDVSQFLPAPDASNHDAIKALANSLVACSRRRRQRLGDPNACSADIRQVDEEDVLEWGESVAPLFAASLATFCHVLCFPNRPFPPTRTSFEYPRIPVESTFFKHGSSPLLFSFGCMSSALNGAFYRLYTSASDGLSFNRLQNSLLGYGGPTLLIVQSGESIFGAFTASAWKESKDFYGNTDCFLFQILPTTAVYRPTGNGRNFMYCNSFARSRGYDNQAHGIGFGGSVDQPRLFLAESFDSCRAASQDLTFENGSLLSKNLSNQDHHFDIDNLEVWGVGGDDVVMEALGARTNARGVRDAAIQKARKVDKAAFLDDFKSGLIDSKAFAHRAQIEGRDGTACTEEDGSHNNKYKYEK